MKQRILFLLLLLLSTWQAWAQVPRTESFETEGNGVAGRYTSNTFNTSNNNYSFRSTYVQGSVPAGYNTTSSRLFGIDGSYFWASEGVKNSIGVPGYVQLTPTTITGFANLKVTVLLADPQGAGSNGGLLRWEADDFIRIKVRIDGGNWTPIGQFVGDLTDAGGVAGYLRRDIDIDGVSTNDPASGNAPDGTRAGQLTATLQPFTFNVTGGGNTMDVMVEIDQSGNSEEFAFDKIQITGTASTNALPQLQNIEGTALAYNEGGPAIQITNTLTVTDADNATLSSGSVRISTNFNASEDVLAFTGDGTTGNITAGTFNTANGTLPLTSAGSTATLAQWQNALRKVTYRNSDAADASSLTRTVSFTVTDPAGGTNVATTRDITVTTALDPAAAPPYTEDFTTDGEGTRYATNRFAPTANSTTFQRTNVTPYPNNPSGVTFTNISNGFYFYGAGVSNSASPNNPKPVFIQTRKVDAAGYVNLKYQVRLGASSQWYKDSYVKLFYRTGTNAWVIFGSFRATDQTTSGAASPLRQDADPNNLSSAPTGTALTTALQTITFNLPAALNGQQVDFRLEANGPTLVEELAVDLIQVTATQVVAPTVTTGTAGSITTTAATISNNSLTTDGGASLTDYGVVYVAGTGTPTTASSKVQAGTTSPGTFPASFSTSLTGLTPGTQYTARAYATNSVGTSYGSNVTFTTAAPVGGTTVVTNVSCNGGTNGAINLTPSGGVGPYTFLWSPGGQTTEDRTGLAAGSYSVTITDATGATGTVSNIIVTQPSALTASTSQINIACNGAATGAASVSPSGGTSPYTYRWSTGATTQAITGLAAGSYSVVVTDANGCTLTRNFPITQPSALTATTSQTDVTTNGGSNGTATITVGGGTPSYTYSWSPNVSTTATASNLSAGTYSVTATDANGCTITRSFTITQPAFTATAQPVTVQLDANGNGTLNASSVNNGSVGGGTLTYTIQKIAFGKVNENSTLTLTTPNGANFSAIRFASYGTPNDNGNGNYTLGSCNAANSVAAATNAYVGRSTGDMYASNTDTRNNPVLGDPCGGTPKALAVQAGYSADAASLTYDCTEAGKTQYVLLTVTNGTNTSTAVAQVTVNAPPTATISSVSPTSAQRGATVTVAGTNLSGVSSVTVNGAAATVSNLTSTGFTFVVPSTATVGTGSIVVATPCAQTLTNTFTVAAPTIVVGPASLPNGQQGTAYSQALSASGGTAPYTYAITAGALPSGLSLNTSGTISGTPNTNGTFNFTVTATDASAAPGPYSGSRSYSLVINAQPTTAAPVVTTPANNSFSNNRSVTVTGTAPAGSTVAIYIGGNLAGTTPATASGTFSYLIPGSAPDGTYVVSATAQSSGATTSPSSNGNTFTIDGTAPTAALSSGTVTSGGTTSTSPVSFTATFNEPVMNFTAAGLTVSNGTVTSGPTAGANNTYTFQVTPSAAGTVTVQVAANAAQDQATNGNTASAVYSFTFAAPTIVVGPTSLPNGQQGTAYSQALSASGGTAPYTYAITAGALPSGLSLSSSGTIAGTPTTNGTFNFTVTATDASAAPGPYRGTVNYSLVITAPAITATTWTGTISTDWFTAGNWTQGVPNATVDATIPTAPSGGRFPAVSAGTATARNLTFNSGATLNQSGGTLAIAANLTNNGTFLPTGGTVNLGTTTQSSVFGSSNIRFWNLTIGVNGAQLSTSIGASLQRLLTLNGNLATNGNQLVLESTNTLTALVVNNNSNVVTGTVTVQRAIDGSVNPGLGYRHYSAPVSNSTVADLTTSGFTPVVNPAFNTVASPYTITPYPTVYGYDDSRLSLNNNLDMFDKGYYSPSALSDPLAVGKGYTVNIAASELVDFQGTLNNGDLPLSFTSTRNTYPDGGWQFLGNPYPAPLDYSRVAAADRNGLESAIYMYSSTTQYMGRYRVYINGIGNPVVPMGQGYFTRVASGQTTANMTFRNSQRLTAPNGTTLQRTTADPRPLVQLTLQGQGAAPADEAYVYFENGATSGFEPAFDAEKLPNPTGFNLSTTQAGKQLSVDGQPELGTAQRVVPLALGVPAAGVYTFTASQLLNLSATPVYLRDLQLGTLTDLRQQPTYQFTVSNAAALNTTRFALVFSPQQALATAPAALAEQVGLYPNPARTQVSIELPLSLSRQPVAATLLDALGRVVRQQALPAGLATHTMPLADMATGVYSLRLTTEKGTVVKKLVVE